MLRSSAPDGSAAHRRPRLQPPARYFRKIVVGTMADTV